jgi:thymidine phosphorylase
MPLKIYTLEEDGKFIEMVNAQGGNIDDVKISSKVFSVKSSKSGFIRDIDAYKLGMLERSLTDGRFNGNNSFDHSVGFRLNKKNGDYVLEDEELLSVYLNEKDIDVKSILDCFDISESCGELAPLIYEIVE